MPVFFPYPASANQMTFQEAQAALVEAQAEVVSASAALESSTTAVQSATIARDSAQLSYSQALQAYNASRVTVPGSSTTTTQNVVRNGTFDSADHWSNVINSTTAYTGGANPIAINGKLKGSYTSGIYILQTGTFPSPTRQVEFAVDVWNNDTNEGNRANNPDYYRIEFRTYAADGARLNYYNFQWSSWHDWLTRGATYTLDRDAVTWDVGFRMADNGFWAGAFGPEMDNVRVIATMGTTTPDTYTYGEAETQALSESQVVLTQSQQNLNMSVSLQTSAQNRLNAAIAEVNRLEALIAELTPRLNAPGNLTYTLNPDSITLYWEAPASNSSGVQVERYAIMWSTTNFVDNGWGWAHDQTSVTIPISILAEHGGLGSTFTFKVRADNDTQQIYSPYSNVVTIETSAPPVQDWWQVQFYEGETVTIGAPEGYKFGYPTAWYGSPTDPTCGITVSAIVNELINGRSTASFVADNNLFTDPCGGVVKVLRMSTPVDQIPPGPTPEEIAAEQARIAAELAAQEAARLEAARLEAERIAAEQAAIAAAAEAARLESERLAAEAAAAEAARIAAEQAAAAEAARIEAERLEAARIEAERIAALERAERERQERLAAEEAARIEAERIAAEQAAEAARLEAERIAREQAAEAARLEAERLEAERLAREAAEAAEAARLEAERLEAERLEKERLAAEEAARLEAERVAAEEAAKEKARLEAEAKSEAERLERERLAEEERKRLEEEANKPKPTPSPEPEPTKEPTPTEKPVVVEIKEPITAENITAVVAELTTIAPQQLTEEQQTLITEAALETFETAEQGSAEYEAALDALLVVAQADDIVIDEELASAPVIGAAVVAVADALNALGNAGADMSPQVREQSEKVVIAAVIVGQVAMTATAAATSAAAAAARRP